MNFSIFIYFKMSTYFDVSYGYLLIKFEPPSIFLLGNLGCHHKNVVTQIMLAYNYINDIRTKKFVVYIY